MNSEKSNRWLTLGSNLAVLVGIALILFELDQNTDLMRAQMSQERANLIVQKYEARIHSDYYPEIIAKQRNFETDREWIESLSPVEYTRVRIAFLSNINDVRNQYYLYSQGYLAKEVWDAQSRNQASRMIASAYALGLNERFEGNPGFRDELRRIAEEDGLPFPNEDGSWDN